MTTCDSGPPSVNNSVSDYDDDIGHYVFGDAVSVTCNEGFLFTDGSPSKHFLCQSYGNWSDIGADACKDNSK